MADLASLFKVAPITAGGFVGEQQASDLATALAQQQEIAARTQGINIDNDYRQQNNPLLLAHQGLLNQQLRDVTIPQGQVALDTSKLKLERDQATQKSAIEAAITDNEGKVDENKFKALTRAQTVMAGAVPILEQTPIPMRAAKLKDYLEQNKYDTSQPMWQQWIRQVGADPNATSRIKTAADAMGNALIQMNPTANAALQGHRLSSSAQVDAAKIRAAATVQAANIGAESRKAVAEQKAKQTVSDIWQLVKAGKIKAPELPAAFKAAAMDPGRSEEERQALLAESERAAQMLLERSAVPKAGSADAAESAGLPAAKPTNPYNTKKRGDGTAANPIKLD